MKFIDLITETNISKLAKDQQEMWFNKWIEAKEKKTKKKISDKDKKKMKKDFVKMDVIVVGKEIKKAK